VYQAKWDTPSYQLAFELQGAYDYFPYGKILRSFVGGNGQERYLTTQHERDEESISENNFGTGYDNRGARLYDSDVARFLSLDPAAAEYPTLSDYSYVLGNPINFIDPDGRYSVSVHSWMTFTTFNNLGFGKEFAKNTAHYASIYADHPSQSVLIGNYATSALGSEFYRSGTDYSATAGSQLEENSKWHSMMSDAEASGGMSHQQAMTRGLQFGWNNIFAQQNGVDMGKLGQGLHALQDAYAHMGASTNEHLGFNASSFQMMFNDMFGSTSDAKLITESAGILFGLITGQNKGLTNGRRLDFSGMSSEQFNTASGLFQNAGYNLNATDDEGFYTMDLIEN
tara:strand:- start:1364 stop:2383 length:1020 start_codon:yes stop_codon:yes gene_type:complete